MRPQFEVGKADGGLSRSAVNGWIERAAAGQGRSGRSGRGLTPLLIYPAEPAGGIREPDRMPFAAVQGRDSMGQFSTHFSLEERTMGLLKEFKEFALRGNVIDLAVGVIIGGAFGKITGSLVNDVLMPPLGIVAKTDFKGLYIPLFDTAKAVTDKKLPPLFSLSDIQKANLPALAYGSFFTAVIDFLILAFCVFLMVKLMNMAIKRFDFLQKQEAAATPPEPPPDVKLLTEIRDLLKAK
jgi:large conductance mechanosensitive channel